MRLRLYQDKENLETVIRRHTEWLSQKPVATLRDAYTLAQIYHEVSPYSYLCAVVLSQSDEKRLQDAVNRLFTVCEKQAPRAVSLLAAELDSPGSDVTAIRSAYQVLQRFSRSPSLEPLLEGSAALEALEKHKHELRSLFGGEHTVNNNALHRQCQRISDIMENVARFSTVNEHTHAHAIDIATYVRHEARTLQLRLAEHMTYTLTRYPLHGVPARIAQDVVKRYEYDCIEVERQLARIITKAMRLQKSKLPPADEAELIVGLRSYKLIDELEPHLRQLGTVERFSRIPYLILRTNAAYAAQVLRKPKSLFHGSDAAIYAPGVYKVCPLHAQAQSEDWNLGLIGAAKAWEKTRGGQVKVAVIDTGIDYAHRDLVGRFGDERGVDYVSGGNPLDDNGHGTHVAGTVAGEKTGVAPEASLYAVKVLDARGSGSEVAVLKGIEWCIEKKVDVINMSLGSAYPSSAEAELVLCAHRAGIAVACAAGNDGDSRRNYPASHVGAISVAAVDKNKKKAPFSNYNDMVDLAAPGVSIYSTWPGGKYNTLSGTSMAAPHVAGACALLRSVAIENPEAKLKSTAEDLGPRTHYGSGLIKVGEAV